MLSPHFDDNDQVYKYFIFKSNVKARMNKAGEPSNCTEGGKGMEIPTCEKY